jgi:hypothetical protein
MSARGAAGAGRLRAGGASVPQALRRLGGVPLCRHIGLTVRPCRDVSLNGRGVVRTTAAVLAAGTGVAVSTGGEHWLSPVALVFAPLIAGWYPGAAWIVRRREERATAASAGTAQDDGYAPTAAHMTDRCEAGSVTPHLGSHPISTA